MPKHPVACDAFTMTFFDTPVCAGRGTSRTTSSSESLTHVRRSRAAAEIESHADSCRVLTVYTSAVILSAVTLLALVVPQLDAITAYEKAIKMASDVPSYKEAYEEFLLRNKIKSSK